MKEIEKLFEKQTVPMTLPEVRDKFFQEYFLTNFEPTLKGVMNARAIGIRLTGRVIRAMAEGGVDQSIRRAVEKDGKRWEVKVYMIDEKTREIFTKVGQVLAGLSEIRDTVVLPETEEELSCLLSTVAKAIKTEEPITFFTPVCPDWSRDKQGRYDFNSLGGGESFIANKFFVNGPEILEVFHRNRIPFKGVILFADWGMETEIDAKDTYGQKLSREDIQMCFASTFAATDQTLKVLQDDERLGPLFANYKVVSMKDFLAERIDEQKVMEEMQHFFSTDKKGKRLLEVLAGHSLAINKRRLGVNEYENRDLALRNLVEYSTVGMSIGEMGILVVCESRTTSSCYNLPREKDKKVPVFYVKGKEALSRGVNIL